MHIDIKRITLEIDFWNPLTKINFGWKIYTRFGWGVYIFLGFFSLSISYFPQEFELYCPSCNSEWCEEDCPVEECCNNNG